MLEPPSVRLLLPLLEVDEDAETDEEAVAEPLALDDALGEFEGAGLPLAEPLAVLEPPSVRLLLAPPEEERKGDAEVDAAIEPQALMYALTNLLALLFSLARALKQNDTASVVRAGVALAFARLLAG